MPDYSCSKDLQAPARHPSKKQHQSLQKSDKWDDHFDQELANRMIPKVWAAMGWSTGLGATKTFSLFVPCPKDCHRKSTSGSFQVPGNAHSWAGFDPPPGDPPDGLLALYPCRNPTAPGASLQAPSHRVRSTMNSRLPSRTLVLNQIRSLPEECYWFGLLNFWAWATFPKSVAIPPIAT